MIESEKSRLEELYSYGILDTAAEQEFDDIVRLASYLCQTPIALISLVDDHRQWFKAKVGISISETPRSIAFCARVVSSEDILEVCDATRDPNFHDNPLVLGDPRLNYYLGVPLRSRNGKVLGSLCVLDTVPRHLEAEQVQALVSLALQTMQLMELRRTIETHRLAQERIARSEEQLFLAVKAGAIGFWDWNMLENTVTMSPLHERLMGLNETGLPRPVQEFFDRLHPDDAPFVTAQVNAAVATHGRYDTEMRVVWPDGSVHWMHDTGIAQYDAEGRPYRMNGTMADISERKRTERELELRQERFDLAVSASNTGVWDWSLATDEWYCSEISMKILGDTPSDPPWTARTMFDRMHPDDRGTVEPFIKEQLQNPEISTWRTEYRSLHRDGSWRWILTQARVARDKSGTAVRMTGTFIDLTEQKERERVLAEAKAMADQANRAKSDFLANMSHEIRTPMHGIIGLTRLLSDSSLDAQQRTFLQGIDSSAQALLRLVNEVLDFSKVEAGKMTLENEVFDLRRMLTDLKQQLDPAALTKGLRTELQVDPLLPECFVGDAGKIRQVLTNLIGNAIKFTDRGYVKIRVQSVATMGKETQLRVEVSDSGIGMPADALGHLFQPFSQLDASRSRRFAGTGLGLSISKRLVTLMGGDLGVHSQLGGGSTFWVTLTLPRAVPVIEPPRWNNSVRSIPTFRTTKPVLVVEDNEINQMIIVSMLEKMGIPSDVAVNGLEGVNQLRRGQYALVLMDCQMPTMDGYEATRAIRAACNEWFHQIPIIAMTANAMRGERERCLEAGMNEYITKPIDENSLTTALQRWLVEPKPEVSPVWDRAAMERLLPGEKAQQSEFMGRIIRKFVGQFPGVCDRLRQARDARDWVTLRREAHSLKSNAAYLGGRQLEELCRVLETSVGDPMERTPSMPEVEQQILRVEEAGRALIRTLEQEGFRGQEAAVS